MKTAQMPCVPFGEGWLVVRDADAGGKPGLVITKLREQVAFGEKVTEEQVKSEIPLVSLRFESKASVENLIKILTELYVKYDEMVDKINELKQPEVSDA